MIHLQKAPKLSNEWGEGHPVQGKDPGMVKHPRFVCHFIPTSSSWLNMVERWFHELTDKAVRHGSFESVPSLEKAIAGFLVA